MALKCRSGRNVRGYNLPIPRSTDANTSTVQHTLPLSTEEFRPSSDGGQEQRLHYQKYSTSFNSWVYFVYLDHGVLTTPSNRTVQLERSEGSQPAESSSDFCSKLVLRRQSVSKSTFPSLSLSLSHNQHHENSTPYVALPTAREQLTLYPHTVHRPPPPQTPPLNGQISPDSRWGKYYTIDIPLQLPLTFSTHATLPDPHPHPHPHTY